jgi:hypothetical protein
MMIAPNVTLPNRYKLYREAISTATKLDWLTIKEIGGSKKTRAEHWGMELPKYAKKYLRVWGEAGVVKVKKVGTPKLANRGKVCMVVGYADSHAADCYRMYDEDTKLVHLTRDIRWLKRMYYDVGEIIMNSVNPMMKVLALLKMMMKTMQLS